MSFKTGHNQILVLPYTEEGFSVLVKHGVGAAIVVVAAVVVAAAAAAAKDGGTLVHDYLFRFAMGWLSPRAKNDGLCVLQQTI